MTALVGGFAGVSRAEDYAGKVKDSMKMLQDKLTGIGAASLKDGALYLGEVKINEKYDVVDEVADAHGCTATVFMKKDKGFERISTNVIKDGKRAVGTPLAETSPAFAPLQKGTAYYGKADILGAQYETGYEPIKDASGQVVGVAYVGYKL